MKKILIVIAVVVLALGVYVGLNSQDKYDSSKYEVTLTPNHDGVQVGDKLFIKLPDQFGKTHTTSGDTKFVIISFRKDDGHVIRNYLKNNKPTLLKEHNAFFLADISKVPIVIRNMVIISDLQKSEFPVLLIHDKAISKNLNTNHKGSMVVSFENNLVKTVTYVNSDKELDKLFKK